MCVIFLFPLFFIFYFLIATDFARKLFIDFVYISYVKNRYYIDIFFVFVSLFFLCLFVFSLVLLTDLSTSAAAATTQSKHQFSFFKKFSLPFLLFFFLLLFFFCFFHLYLYICVILSFYDCLMVWEWKVLKSKIAVHNL